MSSSQLEEIKGIVRRWAENNPLVRAVYIYGSRATEKFAEDSDLDIAVEIDKGPGAENKLATWILESGLWETELQAQLSHKVHIEWYDENDTPTVKAGVENSGILLYSRGK